MNFSVSNNRLKLSNSYDVSGSINSTNLLVGTNVGINPTYVLDVSSNNVNTVKINNIFYVDGSNNRVGIGSNFSNPDYTFDVSGETRIETSNIRIGRNAGRTNQGLNAIAIGNNAGSNNQGANSIAIGYQAGLLSLPEGTIHINASSSAISTVTQPNSLYISSIRNNTTQVSTPVYYDFSTNEVTTNNSVVVYGTNTGDNIEGMYGDGSDGDIILQGYFNSESLFSNYDDTTTTYTLTRDIYPNNLTVNFGITLITAGYRIFCKNTLTNNGIIHNNGSNASGITAGAGGLGGFFKAGGTGANGIGTAAGGAAGTLPPAPTANTLVGNYGGRGACGRANAGQYVSGTNIFSSMTTPANSIGGRKIVSSTSAWIGPYQIGAGVFYQMTPSVGGCGGAKSALGTNATSGGGGGGGGVMFISAYNITGNGAYQCKGGNGGNGVAGTTTCASGGGGGGAGGIIVVYTPPAVWNAISIYFSVDGGFGGTTNYIGSGLNYPLAFAGTSTITGVLSSINYVVPLSPTRCANLNTLYMVSIFTTTVSSLRPAIQGITGYIGKNAYWGYITTVDFGTTFRLELWYGYAIDNGNSDVMSDTTIRVAFDTLPATYRVMVDEINNTSLSEVYNPIGQYATAYTPTIAASLATALPSPPTTGNLIYTVAARNGGAVTPTAGAGNSILQTYGTAPLLASEVSTSQQNNGMSWASGASAGMISVEISQASVPEAGMRGWEGRIIHLGG